MKILYVTSSYDVIDFKFVDSLNSRKHKVDVFIIRPKIIPNKEKIAGVNYFYNPFFIKNKALYTLYYFFSLFKSIILLKNYIEYEKPDILHGGNTQTAGFLCSLLNYHPFLLVTTGSDILVNPKKSRLLYYITKYVSKKADSVICDCEEIRNEFVKITNYKGQIPIFPRGVDQNIFKPEKLNTIRKKLKWENRIIFICTRAHYHIYGIEYILHAFGQIIRVNKNFGLLLIDYTPKNQKALTSKYRQIISKYKLEEHVHMLPPVLNEEVVSYINNSDVYISASLSDGTSVSMLEAMACKIPVIVTDLPSNREWIKDNYNGYLVPKKDIRLLSFSILKIILDYSQRKVMGERNFEIAIQRANWEKHINKLEETYNKILNVHTS